MAFQRSNTVEKSLRYSRMSKKNTPSQIEDKLFLEEFFQFEGEDVNVRELEEDDDRISQIMSESKYKICDGNNVTLYIAEKIYYGELLQGFRFVDLQDKTVYKFEYTYNKYKKQAMKFTTRKGHLIAWLKRKNDHYLIVDVDGDELLKVDMPPECSTFANNDFRVRHITDDAEIGLMSGNWNRFTQNRDFGTEAMVVTFPSDMRTDLKFMFLSICIYFDYTLTEEPEPIAAGCMNSPGVQKFFSRLSEFLNPE